MSEQDKTPVEQTICLNPIHNETICSQNQDFYTHKQEPAAWRLTNSSTGQIELDWDCEGWSKDFDIRTPLYTHPKQWVGLTDDEIKKEFDRECWVRVIFADGTNGIALDKTTAIDFARTIEAKLKGKNT